MDAPFTNLDFVARFSEAIPATGPPLSRMLKKGLDNFVRVDVRPKLNSLAKADE
jgi:hypothetical protein